METRTALDFAHALNRFLDHIIMVTEATYSKPTYSLQSGKRYIRIARNDGVSRSVYGFVDATDGSILKADSWKRPAKHARGSIFNIETWGCAGPYGIASMR